MLSKEYKLVKIESTCHKDDPYQLLLHLVHWYKKIRIVNLYAIYINEVNLCDFSVGSYIFNPRKKSCENINLRVIRMYHANLKSIQSSMSLIWYIVTHLN